MSTKKFSLIVDGKSVTVRPGTTILDAAGAAEASVPTLCHEQGLHPYGACRICLVEVEGPPRRQVPACTTPAAEGMIVHTISPAVVNSRKAILELLLINHPLDCPVCDKAGECRLQDLVHEYGLGPGLFAERKRTTAPDYVSPVIERNHNRCIFCGKCVRACRERCGVGALTFSMRGGNSRISAAFDEPLDCEFCGECVEVCPVGALTTRQFKHRARAWNLEQAPSTCIYCGHGCSLVLETNRGSLVRARPAANGYLCAKGRFGWDAVRHESRITLPKLRVAGKLVDCSWDEALSAIVTHMNVIRNRSGASSIGGLGSVRTTNEENYLFQKFMRTVAGSNNVDLLARIKLPFGLNSAYFAEETGSIGNHDVIIVLEKDLAGINPRTGIEIVRAVNRGAKHLIMIGGKPGKLTVLSSVSLPEDVDAALSGLTTALRQTRRVVSERTRRAVELLSAANSVAVILPFRCTPDTFGFIREFTDLLKNAVWYPVVMGGNVQGALDMGMMPEYYPGYLKTDPAGRKRFEETWHSALPERRGLSAVEMIRGIESNAVSALYIMGDDPAGSDPALAAALKQLEFLVVQDIFLTETAEIAHVVLPAAGFTEKSGTITTMERRLKHLARISVPPGEARPDWEIVQSLAQRLGAKWNYASEADIMKEIRSVVPMYRALNVGSCWPREQSPLAGTIADLSLDSDGIMPCEVITAGRLLFSSGTMATRSKELTGINHTKKVAS